MQATIQIFLLGILYVALDLGLSARLVSNKQLSLYRHPKLGTNILKNTSKNNPPLAQRIPLQPLKQRSRLHGVLNPVKQIIKKFISYKGTINYNTGELVFK